VCRHYLGCDDGDDLDDVTHPGHQDQTKQMLHVAVTLHCSICFECSVCTRTHTSARCMRVDVSGLVCDLDTKRMHVSVIGSLHACPKVGVYPQPK
jgi:hypothetical protein